MNSLIAFANKHNPTEYSKHNLSERAWEKYHKQMIVIVKSTTPKERLEFINHSLKLVT